MEHTENNILIADFMGLELEETLTGLKVYARKHLRNPNKLNDIVTDYYEPKELKYHNSWDWLMPVVEQIKNIGTHSKTTDLEYTLLDNIDDALIIVRIDLVYSAVIEFIKWHNKNLDRL